MVKILNCYLNAKKSSGTLSKGAICLANPVLYIQITKTYWTRGQTPNTFGRCKHGLCGEWLHQL